jgi:hypothetical protein
VTKGVQPVIRGFDVFVGATWSLNITDCPISGVDTDAAAYIAAVESADSIALDDEVELEAGVKTAIDTFVKGCKSDGIWDAIKASCILAGARTLPGALVPLKGSAPTNVGTFGSGDYNRKTGLVGNGTNYLDTNYAYGSGLQDDKHVAVYATAAQNDGTSSIAYCGSSNAASTGTARSQILAIPASTERLRSRLSDETTTQVANTNNANGLIGINRSGSGSYIQRGNGTNQTVNVSSLTGAETNMFIFRRVASSMPPNPTSARLAFYSVGEALDLEKLDTRVTALINAYDAAI